MHMVGRHELCHLRIEGSSCTEVGHRIREELWGIDEALLTVLGLA